MNTKVGEKVKILTKKKSTFKGEVIKVRKESLWFKRNNKIEDFIFWDDIVSIEKLDEIK